MKKRNVELVALPPEPHWVGNGFRVHNFIPGSYHLEMERMTPFILLDYNSKYYFPPSETPQGVGVHPHRGFETVTIAYKGKVEHHDSHGGGGIIGEGDVQWMTAASGVLHKEYHEKAWSRKGGDFHVVQRWVNVPAKDEISSHYKRHDGKIFPPGRKRRNRCHCRRIPRSKRACIHLYPHTSTECQIKKRSGNKFFVSREL